MQQTTLKTSWRKNENTLYMKEVLNRVKNMAKGEIAHHFSFSHNVFKSCLLQRRQKAYLCWKGFKYTF